MLLDTSKVVNSKAISLIRCLISVLVAYSHDGIQYRELKAALNISDGKLISNLNRLIEMGYIEKKEVKLDRKTMSIYLLTKEGEQELKRIEKWIETFQRVLSQVCERI